MANKENSIKKIKTALISLSDKSNLKQLLQILKKHNIRIISSGGTFKEIKKLRYNCMEVSNFTGFNEILDGKYDDLPEQSFYLVGGMDEVIAKAAKLKG